MTTQEAVTAPTRGKRRGAGIVLPESPDTVKVIDQSLVDPCPFNVRKTMGDVSQLADSIENHGQMQNVLVRPHPESPGRYQLVFGHRRLAAIRLKSMITVRAEVRELTDRQALELMLAENRDREDVPPLEEADGYRMLRDVHGVPVDEIAARVARSEAYVRARLQLLLLCPEAVERVASGRYSLSVALQLCRLHDHDAQRRAIKDADRYGEVTASSMRRSLLQQVHTFDRAPFDPADDDLVAEAGPCTRCPKRASAQTELFGALPAHDNFHDDEQGNTEPRKPTKPTPIKQDRCMDAACWDKKVSVGTAAKLAKLEAKGVEVIDAKKAFDKYGTVSKEFVKLDEHAWGVGTGNKTYRQLVGKDVETMAVVAPDGTVQELARAKDVKEATGTAVKASAADERWKREQKMSAAIDQQFKPLLTAMVVERMEKRPPADGIRALIAMALADEHVKDGAIAACTRRALVEKLPAGKHDAWPKARKAVAELAAKEKNPAKLAAILAEVLMGERDWSDSRRLSLAAQFKVDPKKLAADIRKGIAAKLKGDRAAKKAGKKPAK